MFDGNTIRLKTSKMIMRCAFRFLTAAAIGSTLVMALILALTSLPAGAMQAH